MHETALWFSPKEIRRISIRSSAVLVGKAPTKQKRIKILATMPVTGQKVTGYPRWLEDAITYVMKNGQVVKPDETIDYCNITMSDANLFRDTPIEAPKSRISNFSIENVGESEDPQTVVKFQIMVAFSTDLHRWCGQMAGEEFDAQFELTIAPDEDGGDDPDDDALDDEPETSEGRNSRESKAVCKAKQNLSLL